jgi:hypothetical protein
LYLPSSNTPVPVPYDWLHDYYPDIEPNLSAPPPGANGVPVWHSYVAGLNPLDPKSQFVAGINISNNIPRVTWSPNRKDRAYVVEGKTNLTDSVWSPSTPCEGGNAVIGNNVFGFLFPRNLLSCFLP